MSLSDEDHSLSTRFHKGKGSNPAEKDPSINGKELAGNRRRFFCR